MVTKALYTYIFAPSAALLDLKETNLTGSVVCGKSVSLE